MMQDGGRLRYPAVGVQGIFVDDPCTLCMEGVSSVGACNS